MNKKVNSNGSVKFAPPSRLTIGPPAGNQVLNGTAKQVEQSFNYIKTAKRFAIAFAAIAGAAVFLHERAVDHKNLLIGAEKQKFLESGQILHGFTIARDFPHWTPEQVSKMSLSAVHDKLKIPSAGADLEVEIKPLPPLSLAPGQQTPLTQSVFAELDRLHLLPAPAQKASECAIFSFNASFKYDAQQRSFLGGFGAFDVIACRTGSGRTLLPLNTKTNVTLNDPAAFESYFQSTQCVLFRDRTAPEAPSTIRPTQYNNSACPGLRN